MRVFAFVFICLSQIGFAIDLKKEGFDVNDVSILFAKNKAHMKPYPEIAGSTSDVLPATLLNDLVRFAHAEEIPRSRVKLVLHAAARAPGGWYVQGLRADDCAPKDGAHEAIETKPSPEKCEFQLRLVLQPIEKATDQNQGHLNLGFQGNSKGEEEIAETITTGDLVTTDNALHLIFKIAAVKDQEDLLVDLQNIKLHSPVKTARLPLGAHPGLLSELKSGKTDELSQRVKDFVAKYAKTESLKRVTFFGPTSREWVFFAGKVFRDSAQKWRWEVLKMANAGDSRVQALGIGAFDPSRPVPTVTNANKVSREKLRFAVGSIKGETEEDAKKRIRESLGASLHPYTIHSENTDCVSCHMVGFDFHYYSNQWKKDKVLEIVSDGNFLALPEGVTPFLSFAKEVSTGFSNVSNNWNMRSFGYYFAQPMVSFRTLMESVRVASSLNKTHNLSGNEKSCKSKERYAGALEKFASIHPYADEAKFIDECE